MQAVHGKEFRRFLMVLGAFAMVATLGTTVLAFQRGVGNGGGNSESVTQRGLAISPVLVNLVGKNPAMVAEGSYIVNTSGCTDCHTAPEFADGGNPFLGEPEQINTEGFLAGGRAFGPFFVSRNLTPDRSGLPAGMTLNEFVVSMRTGIDVKAIPPADLLQVMPWPVVAKHTDANLQAIYAYLSAIPCIEGGPGMPEPPATRC
jgi:hypothetical protein